MSPLDEYDAYVEGLLLKQFEVSEKVFSHNLSKGESREDFIKQQINSQYSGIEVVRGFVEGRGITASAGQNDLIVCSVNGRVRRHGERHCLVEARHCKMVVEVKTNASGGDFRDFNAKAGLIKSFDPDHNPICGLFAYRINLEQRNILNRFGFTYNSAIEGFVPNPLQGLVYPNIDFVVSLHLEEEDQDEGTFEVNKQFFLRKDSAAGTYNLFPDFPVSRYFFDMLDGI